MRRHSPSNTHIHSHSASLKAMHETLALAKKGESFEHLLASFDETKAAVGFPGYYDEEDRYRY